MNRTKTFTFCYPVTIMTAKGPVCLDTLTIDAVANLYYDGTVRTVDIDKVVDGDGHEVTKWMPFIESMSGDLNKEAEQAAMEHISAMIEIKTKHHSLFRDIADIVYPGFLAEA